MNPDTSQSNGAAPDAQNRQSVSIERARLRFWGGTLGILTAIADTAGLKWLGTSFAINGRDVTMFTAAWFGFSFAILGYLLGDAIDGRRREHRAAGLIRTQMETINESRAKLVQNEKLAALGQLAAAIAHEVRNPLAVIRSAAQNLADTLPGDNAEARRACAFITAESDRLGNLINSLLAFARPVQIAPERIPINLLFDRALSLAAELQPDKHVAVRCALCAELATISVDPELMSQVFVDLVANAIDAVPSYGEVTLEAHSRGANVELAVADSGPGVAPELRNRIFEPFFTTRAEGIGLGLAIARQIVEAHGGSIELGNSDSGGARFIVILPNPAHAARTL